jgi:uncharacterized NAD(P)/FAD-binding protein YdhS
MQWSCAEDDRRQVIIIGGGASGVLLACQLLHCPSDDLDVTLIEKRPDVGRGYRTASANLAVLADFSVRQIPRACEGLADVHRHRMAPEVESRINAAIASGLLTVMAAKLCVRVKQATGSVTGGVVRTISRPCSSIGSSIAVE